MARSTHETRFVLSAKDKTKSVFGGVSANLKGVGKSVTGLHTALLGLAGIGGIGYLAKSLIDVNAEFQTIKSSLKTVTGGTKEAAKAFELIEKFATTTPFDLQQVTQSFIKLKALGLDPSEAALRSYGNTASAMGKSMDQMIEAVADASTGEFERLKEFGIKAAKAKDEVTFTFQGVAKTIKNNSAEIQQYLMDIGNVQFGGAMSDQMKNLTPAFSNFDMAIKGIALAIGEAGLNDKIAELTNNTTAWIESLDASKIAEFTINTLENLEATINGINEGMEILGGVFAAPQLAGNGPGAVMGQGIPGGDPGYQLGDFNRANPTSFEDWKSAIEQNTEAIKTNRGAVAG
jgi:phage tail tape-measure protein